MKDGIGTIYIPAEEFFEFIRKQADLPKITSTVIGRPKWINPEEIEIDYAFTDCEAITPEDWGGTPGQKVQEIKDQWNEGESDAKEN